MPPPHNSNETSWKAQPFTEGDRLYQQRARKALPILVRQARAGRSISYSALAEELGMSNPRNLNYVLGSIGQAAKDWGQAIGEDVPPITCLVLNKSSGLPGEGIGWFISKARFASLGIAEKREIVALKLNDIYRFPRWGEMLADLGLEDSAALPSAKLETARHRPRGSGEGPEHERLKQWCRDHPGYFGLSGKILEHCTEYLFPTADRLDVLFKARNRWLGLEVKAHISDEADLIRGLYQCVKYRALLEAEAAVEELHPEIRIVLATERALTPELQRLRNLLNVETAEVEMEGNTQ